MINFIKTLVESEKIPTDLSIIIFDYSDKTNFYLSKHLSAK